MKLADKHSVSADNPLIKDLAYIWLRQICESMELLLRAVVRCHGVAVGSG